MKWLSLYIIFTFTFILFNMINYYSFTPSSPKSKIDLKISSNSMNWKW